MKVGLTAIRLPVRDLERSLALYRDCMGCAEIARNELGIVTLEAGGIYLDLERAPRPLPVRLRFQTSRLGPALERLETFGLCRIREPVPVAGRELEAELEDPDGHRLVLWRRLTEDDLDEEPELEVTATWNADARALLRSLLAAVPVRFRDLARLGAVAEAEWLAVDGERVERIHAVRAFIRSSPRLMRDHLRAPLEEHGLEPGDYVVDFEC